MIGIKNALFFINTRFVIITLLYKYQTIGFVNHK